MFSRERVNAYAGYVFDLDGTLFTIPVDWASAKEKIGRILGLQGNFQIFPTLERELALRPGIRDYVFRELDEMEAAALGDAKPIDGSVDSLLALSKKARVGLVTMQGSSTCRTLLPRSGIDAAFSAVVTREQSLNRKHQIEKALGSMGVEPSRALMVGDKISDGESGVEAGVDSVVVGRGTGFVKHAGKEFALIGSIEELFGTLLK